MKAKHVNTLILFKIIGNILKMESSLDIYLLIMK